MRIILLGEELARSYSLSFDRRWLIALAALLLALLLTVFFLSYLVYDRGVRVEYTQRQIEQLRQDLLFDQQQLQTFYGYSNGVFQEQAKQTGLLQARIARLEALGSRLADIANFSDEFDFYSMPALGGPDDLLEADDPLRQLDIRQAINQMNINLDRREQELKAIDGLLSDRQLQQERYLAGRPVASGWLSSQYGKRIDPFHGRTAWHKGVDFAGKEGADILAVASGVVVWSGERYGFGLLVEINHGNGFVTRYAHNKKNNVKIGDVVTKGQVIAQMGSSGRSTGPHVHFEVLKNGQAVDPRNYIYRKSL